MHIQRVYIYQLGVYVASIRELPRSELYRVYVYRERSFNVTVIRFVLTAPRVRVTAYTRTCAYVWRLIRHADGTTPRPNLSRFIRKGTNFLAAESVLAVHEIA